VCRPRSVSLSGCVSRLSASRLGAVLGVALRRLLLAIDRGLISTTCRPLTLLVLADTLKACDLTNLGGALSLVGAQFAQICRLLADIGFLISLIGGSLARPSCRGTRGEALLAGAHLPVAHLQLDLARLEIDFALLDRPTSRRPLPPVGDPVPLRLGRDQIRPTALQRRASTLVRRPVTMEIGPRVVPLLRPEGGRLLMRLGRALMASLGLLVTAH
jgi:hypothetical protein